MNSSNPGVRQKELHTFACRQIESVWSSPQHHKQQHISTQPHNHTTTAQCDIYNLSQTQLINGWRDATRHECTSYVGIS